MDKYSSIWLILAFCATQLQNVAAEATVEVIVSDGILKGAVKTSLASNKTYYSFQGVPFAKPPLGKLRFREPQAPGAWQGVREALQSNSGCPQKSKGQEDCLYCNVYTPQIPGNKDSGNMATMVYFHGGGFITGSGSISPDYLVDEGIVVVACNDRLGALGFLSLDGADVAANAGLKDQLAALRWVKTNIAQFGGDPGNVTIFGHSAGGASTTYHLLSPLSAGLFHRVITMSGSTLDPWAFMKNDPTPKTRAFRLGSLLGYQGNSSQELVDFLRTVDVSKIVAEQYNVMTDEEYASGLTYPFVPTVEESSYVRGDEVFLPEDPIKLLESGRINKVPYMAGDTSLESREHCARVNSTAGELQQFDEHFEQFVPLDLSLTRGSQRSLQAAAAIKTFYFGNRSVSADTLLQYCHLKSDITYVRGVYKTMSEAAVHSGYDTYNYQFAFDGGLSTSRFTGANTTLRGPSHSDEMNYIFLYKPAVGTFSHDSHEMTVQRWMVALWTGFAKTGDPTRNLDVTWKPYSPKKHYYLKIDAELSLNENLERMSFWDNFYNTYSNTTIKADE